MTDRLFRYEGFSSSAMDTPIAEWARVLNPMIHNDLHVQKIKKPPQNCFLHEIKLNFSFLSTTLSCKRLSRASCESISVSGFCTVSFTTGVVKYLLKYSCLMLIGGV